MSLRKNEIITVGIDDLAFGGKGVAKHEGKIIFVDGGLPGDKANARITKVKPNYCESKIEDIVKPSPFRINPVCEHFDICGGCKWQDYQYNMQLKYKQEQLRQHLIRIAGIDNPTVEPIIAARKTYFYRNKMEYSFHQDTNGDLLLGLHYQGFFDRVFNLNRCHLQSELSSQIVNFVRDECRKLNLPAYHIKEHKGLMRFLVIREGKFTNEILINIVTGGDYDKHAENIIRLGKAIAARFKNINSVIWSVNSRKANIARADSYPPMPDKGMIFGRDHIFEKLNEYKYRISADSFFQTNSFQAQLLYDTIIDYAGFSKNDIVCDLYCGTGTIAIHISGLVKSVIGIEAIESSVIDARSNAELNGVNNVKFVTAKVEDYTGQPGVFDKLIVDPPRAGIHPKALKGIINLSPKVIIYVSCNPATLARDIAGFKEAGYALEKSVAVDMFPHTYHIESVSKLTRVAD